MLISPFTQFPTAFLNLPKFSIFSLFIIKFSFFFQIFDTFFTARGEISPHPHGYAVGFEAGFYFVAFKLVDKDILQLIEVKMPGILLELVVYLFVCLF